MTRPGVRFAVLVADHGGAAASTRSTDGVVTSAAPPADTDPLAFLPYADEVAEPSPLHERDAYPVALAAPGLLLPRLPRSPDVAIMHTAGH